MSTSCSHIERARNLNPTAIDLASLGAEALQEAHRRHQSELGFRVRPPCAQSKVHSFEKLIAAEVIVPRGDPKQLALWALKAQGLGSSGDVRAAPRQQLRLSTATKSRLLYIVATSVYPAVHVKLAF